MIKWQIKKLQDGVWVIYRPDDPYASVFYTGEEAIEYFANRKVSWW